MPITGKGAFLVAQVKKPVRAREDPGRTRESRQGSAESRSKA